MDVLCDIRCSLLRNRGKEINDFIESPSSPEASCGAAARGVTVKSTGCGFDLHSRR